MGLFHGICAHPPGRAADCMGLFFENRGELPRGPLHGVVPPDSEPRLCMGLFRENLAGPTRRAAGWGAPHDFDRIHHRLASLAARLARRCSRTTGESLTHPRCVHGRSRPSDRRRAAPLPRRRASLNCPDRGHVAEWLRNGLQNRVPRFNSGRGLQNPFLLSCHARASRRAVPAAPPSPYPAPSLPVTSGHCQAARRPVARHHPRPSVIRRQAHDILNKLLHAAMQHVNCCCAVSPSDFSGIPDYLRVNLTT